LPRLDEKVGGGGYVPGGEARRLKGNSGEENEGKVTCGKRERMPQQATTATFFEHPFKEKRIKKEGGEGGTQIKRKRWGNKSANAPGRL